MKVVRLRAPYLGAALALPALIAFALISTQEMRSPATLTAMAGTAACGCVLGWCSAARTSRIGALSREKTLRGRVFPPQFVDPDGEDKNRRITVARTELERIRRRSASGRKTACDISRAQAIMTEIVNELSRSADPRDAEAGRLLLDYYIKHVGSHEVVMERLYLSRPTFYRRLKHGLMLVGERLEERVA